MADLGVISGSTVLGAFSGLLVSLVTVLGLRDRLTRVEDNKVDRTEFTEFKESNDNMHVSIEKKIDSNNKVVISRLDRIEDLIITKMGGKKDE